METSRLQVVDGSLNARDRRVGVWENHFKDDFWARSWFILGLAWTPTREFGISFELSWLVLRDYHWNMSAVESDAHTVGISHLRLSFYDRIKFKITIKWQEKITCWWLKSIYIVYYLVVL